MLDLTFDVIDFTLSFIWFKYQWKVKVNHLKVPQIKFYSVLKSVGHQRNLKKELVVNNCTACQEFSAFREFYGLLPWAQMLQTLPRTSWVQPMLSHTIFLNHLTCEAYHTEESIALPQIISKWQESVLWKLTLCSKHQYITVMTLLTDLVLRV
jgi:hypothetical protein